MRKETGERNAPHGSLVPDGQPRERTPERGPQPFASLRRAAWPASCRPSPPRRTLARQAIKGDLTSKQGESDSEVLRTSLFRALTVWGTFCFDVCFPLGLASSVRPGTGSGGMEAARAGSRPDGAWLRCPGTGCALEVRPSGSRPFGRLSFVPFFGRTKKGTRARHSRKTSTT